MGLFQHGHMTEGRVGADSLAHSALLELYHQNAHQQRLGLHGTDAAQIDDHVSVKQLHGLSGGTENLPVDAVGQRLHPCHQRAGIIALGIP